MNVSAINNNQYTNLKANPTFGSQIRRINGKDCIKIKDEFVSIDKVPVEQIKNLEDAKIIITFLKAKKKNTLDIISLYKKYGTGPLGQ